MVSIWGPRALGDVLGTGAFLCPRCQADREYRYLRRRRWFTVLSVPLVPLGRRRDRVECGGCRGTFAEAVLGAPTAARSVHRLALATRAAAAHLVSVTGSTPAAVDGALALLTECPGVAQPYTERHLVADVPRFADRTVALGYLAPLAGAVPVADRAALVRRVVLLAEAVEPSASREAVDAIADAVGIGRAHLAAIRERAAREGRDAG